MVGTHCSNPPAPAIDGNIVSYLLEYEVGVAPPDALDGGHGEHDVALPVNVGVEHTQDVLEVGGDHQRHGGG